MATYMILLRFTHKGIEKIKNSPDRLNSAKKTFKDLGAEIKAFYLLMGQYDAVIIAEAPDDETAAKLALSQGALGNVSTETFRAFTEEEYQNIISSIPLSPE